MHGSYFDTRVAPRSLARMADRGEISAIRLPSGRRRYRREEIEEIAAGAGQAHSRRSRSGEGVAA
jgi:predicted site-specific integrase-resolvase